MEIDFHFLFIQVGNKNQTKGIKNSYWSDLDMKRTTITCTYQGYTVNKLKEYDRN